MHTCSALAIYIGGALSPLFRFRARAVADAVNQGGSGIAARQTQRTDNERDGETEWHGEEDAGHESD